MNRSTVTWGKRAGLSLLVVLSLAAGWWYLQSGYGETGEQGYAYAVALFSACNQRDQEKLRRVEEMIHQDLQAGQLSRQEAEWLQAIIAKGQRGDWKAANRDVRRLMEDQVRQGPAR